MWESAWTYLADAGRDLTAGWLAKVALSPLAAVVVVGIGGWDKMANGLFVLMCLDFALGFARGWANDCLSARKFRRGLAKFFLYAAAIYAASTLDGMCNVKIGWLLHMDFRSGMVMYLAVNEMLSILGHLNSFGVPLPRKLIQRLTDYRDCTVFSAKESRHG